jgi:hypothetical protein
MLKEKRITKSTTKTIEALGEKIKARKTDRRYKTKKNGEKNQPVEATRNKTEAVSK